MLEGSATHVAPAHPPDDLEASVRWGVELLERCFTALYEQGDRETAEELITEGLTSNGPFYWLGAHMAEALIRREGDATLGCVLQEGSPSFFVRYFGADPPGMWTRAPEIWAKARELAAQLNKET